MPYIPVDQRSNPPKKRVGYVPVSERVSEMTVDSTLFNKKPLTPTLDLVSIASRMPPRLEFNVNPETSPAAVPQQPTAVSTPQTVQESEVPGIAKGVMDIASTFARDTAIRVPYSLLELSYRLGKAALGPKGERGTAALTEEFKPLQTPIGEVESYYQTAMKDIKAGRPIYSSVGEQAFNFAIDEPYGMAFKGLFAVLGTVGKKLLPKAIQSGIDIIAKSGDEKIIYNTLVDDLGVLPKYADTLAPRLVETNTADDVMNVLMKADADLAKIGKVADGAVADTAKVADVAKVSDNMVSDTAKVADGAAADTARVTSGAVARATSAVTSTAEDDLVKQISKIAENSIENSGVGVRDASLDAIRKTPQIVSDGVVKLREIENGAIVIEDGRHRLQVALERGMPVRFEDITAEYTGKASDKIADLIKTQPLSVDDAERIARNERLSNPDDLITRGLARAEELKSGATSTPLFDGATPKSKRLKFTETVQDSSRTVKEVADKAYADYTPVPNAQSVEEASQILARGDDFAEAFIKESEPTSTSFAVAQLLMEKYQLSRRFDAALNVVTTISEKAKTAGQAIQSLSLWGRLTPNGILRFAERQLKKAGKELTPDLADKLYKQSKIVQEITDPYEKQFQTAVMLKMISDEIPVSKMGKLALAHTMSLLLNPKTIVRNLIGNGAFMALENVSDVFGAMLDTGMSFMTGVRTKVAPSVMRQVAGMKSGWEQGVRETLAGVNVRASTQYELPKTQVFKSGIGKKLEQTLNITLRVPDRAFFESAYQGSLYDQMKAYNLTNKGKPPLTVPTEEMKEIATYEGLYRTYQDDSLLANKLSELKKWMNSLTKSPEFGMGDVILKFPKTPANLLNRGVAYSPFGFARSAFLAAQPLMGKAKFNQRAFVQSFSRAFTGSAGLFGSGMLLYKLGILTGASDEPTDVKQAKRQQGIRDYQINASALKRFVLSGLDPEAAKTQKGDQLVTYDWMQPASLPIVMGANLVDGANNKATTFVWEILQSVAEGTDMLVEQPLLRGVKKYTEDIGYYGLSKATLRQLSELPASFVPTLFNQAAQLLDNTSRSTTDEDLFKQTINKVKARIPGLSTSVEPVVGTFGTDQEKYQNSTNNPFNVFFNPLFINEYKDDPAISLSLELYNQSLDAAVVPDAKRRTQKVNGENVTLGPRTYTEFRRFVGTRSRMYLEQLATNEQFNALSDEEKVKYVAQLLRDVHEYGKIVVLGDRPTSPSKRVMMMYEQDKASGNLEQ